MDLTQLLVRASAGETVSAERLMSLIYERLRSIAGRQLRGSTARSALETRELVSEAYLALFDGQTISWRDREHFFAYAATTMRNLLAQQARSRLAQKRGGCQPTGSADEVDVPIEDESLDLVALDRALTEISADHPRLVKVVELRYFAGLSVEETAQCLQVDSRTIIRDWQKARALINRALDRIG